MEVVADDLIHPKGQIDPEVYPGDDLTGDLSVWIDEAMEETDERAAVSAYAYHRAFAFICDRLQDQPAEAQADEGTRYRRRMEQIRHFCGKASRYLEEWEEAIGQSNEPGPSFSVMSPTRSPRTRR